MHLERMAILAGINEMKIHTPTQPRIWIDKIFTHLSKMNDGRYSREQMRELEKYVYDSLIRSADSEEGILKNIKAAFQELINSEYTLQGIANEMIEEHEVYEGVYDGYWTKIN